MINKRNYLLIILPMYLFFILPLFNLSNAEEKIDWCSNLSSIPNCEGRCLYTTPCLKYTVCSKKQRVEILCQMRNAILKKYSLRYLKEERVGTNAKEHLNQCIDNEVKVEINNNLDFIDRAKKCIAAFKDTHFHVRAMDRTPWIYTGIVIQEIGGKFYIARNYKKILRYLKRGASKKEKLSGLLDDLAVGNQILKIDGLDPSKMVEKLMPYIHGSSETYRRAKAVKSLMRRNFAYPKSKDQNEVKITVYNFTTEEESTISLPWWYSSTKRKDAKKLFEKIDIPSLNYLRWSYKDYQWVSSSSVRYHGYSIDDHLIWRGSKEKDKKKRKKPPYRGKIETYKDLYGYPALRIGMFFNRGKNFCYMQLLSFSESTLYLGEDSYDFIEPIRGHVKVCEEQGLPLIFDLRSNGGGNGKFPAKVLSVLAESDAVYPNKFYSFRKSTHTYNLLTECQDDKYFKAKYLSDFTFSDVVSELMKEFDKIIDDPEKKHLPMVTADNIETDSKVGGYHQKIVTLITPNCISACDNMANLLKKSGRSILLGTHTNGTGAGFFSSGPHGPSWKDATNDVLRLSIPNYLFGVLDKIAETREDHIVPFSEGKKFVTENRPILADYEYRTNLKDITGKYNGWLNTALQLLFPKEKAKEKTETKSKEKAKKKTLLDKLLSF